jgi:hypothetical protein
MAIIYSYGPKPQLQLRMSVMYHQEKQYVDGGSDKFYHCCSKISLCRIITIFRSVLPLIRLSDIQ